MKELFRYIYKNKIVSVIFKLLIAVILLYMINWLFIYVIDEFSFLEPLLIVVFYIFYILAFSIFTLSILLIITVIFRIVRYKIIKKPCGGVPEHRILDME
jgi:hypothetical protein